MGGEQKYGEAPNHRHWDVLPAFAASRKWVTIVFKYLKVTINITNGPLSLSPLSFPFEK